MLRFCASARLAVKGSAVTVRVVVGRARLVALSGALRRGSALVLTLRLLFDRGFALNDDGRLLVF
jgi:hypothetical protein